MIIQSVKVKNFRSFEGEHEFVFRRLNLLVGKIGAGKSTIGRIAICFALFGEYEDTLAKLPTRGTDKETEVELIIKVKSKKVRIVRNVPTKLRVYVEGVEILPGSTNAEKDKWLKERFKDYSYFKKFRMIDSKQGSNILEEGKTGIRRTLISFHESILNNIRERLQKKKSFYDKYNKDTALIYKHYPSEKRLLQLEKSYSEIKQNKDNLNSMLRELQNDYNSLSHEHGGRKQAYSSTMLEIKQLSRPGTPCPLCKKSLDENLRIDMLSRASDKLKSIAEQAREVEKNLEGQKEALEHVRNSFNTANESNNRIQQLITKLSARMKQKEYKYTNKDILLVSNAIKELDKFYSYFILYSVKSLEPVINNIIAKIGFELSFRLDEKGDFDIVLLKEGEEFSYKDLSSGQRIILTIAFQIALLLDKGETGVIIADEGFSNLDADSITVLYNLFDELPFQVISIVHRFDDAPKEINIINF